MNKLQEVAVVPEGWSVTFAKFNQQMQCVLAAHPEHPPRVVRLVDLPLAFEHWKEIVV